MPEIDRRALVALLITVFFGFFIGFMVGTGTEDGSTASSGNVATTSVVAVGSQSESANASSTDPATEDTPIDGNAAAVLPPPATEPGDIPQYGTDNDRQALITGLVEAGVSGGSATDILATADYVCYTLERLQAQRRSLSFTVRVVWNESLAELPPEDLAAFGAVLSAAPPYLCPENAAFAEDVSYWIGY